MSTAATLGFVAKGVHTTLGSQVRVGAGLEVVIVVARCARCIKVTWWAWAAIARATVVKLTGWALALRTIAVTCRAVIAPGWAFTKLLSAFTFAWRAVTQTVTADVAVGARGSATACGFGIANALHHFAASSFSRSRHDVTAWGLA